MKIRFTIGPNAGQEWHVERSEAIGLLIACGLMEVVSERPRPAPATLPDDFAVIQNPSGLGGFVIRINRAGGKLGVQFFDGDPKLAPAYIPQAVRDEYAMLRGGPQLDPDAVRMRRERLRIDQEVAVKKQNILTPAEIKAGAHR